MGVIITGNEEMLTASVRGDIDHHNAKDIREQIDRSVESTKPNQLVLDFKEVSFMDSSGIGLVMGRYKLMQEIGGTVRISNTSAHIKKVMKLAGLDRLADFD